MSNDESKPSGNDLTESEKSELKDRFGIDVDANPELADIARQFEITRRKIEAIEKKARKKRGDDKP
ncbi:MAG: hypothetical protein AAGJ55_02970, partial [Cyanobacteria bacterium J06555_12]